MNKTAPALSLDQQADADRLVAQATLTLDEQARLDALLGMSGARLTHYLHTFEHVEHSHAAREGSEHARNYAAGIARCARAAGLVAKRDRAGRWSFILPRFGFAPASHYRMRN